MKMYAATDRIQSWADIDFHKAEKNVKKLQKRIAEAFHNDELDRVESLQHKMIHSFYAKALAVKSVTSKRGKDPPGVDDILWIDSKEKYDAIYMLRRRGYHPKPLKRIFIPKSDGGYRPLSIPTMIDRAMQPLYKFALDPIGGLTADPSSFAYLPGCSAKGAVIRLGDVLLNRPDFLWVMKADIKACFDNISHEWILEHIPMDKVILRKFLKCGYVQNMTYHPTERGVPQGGCISCTICNMVLDGLEALLEERFGQSVSMIRYADDIIIVGESQENLVQAVTPVVNSFLSERGLFLSEGKTGFFPVDKKVNFLGWEVYKEGGNVISVPSRKRIDVLLGELQNTFSLCSCVSYEELCNKLGQQIRGWINYYAGVAPVQSLYAVEFEVVSLLSTLSCDSRLAGFIGAVFSRYVKNP